MFQGIKKFFGIVPPKPKSQQQANSVPNVPSKGKELPAHSVPVNSSGLQSDQKPNSTPGPLGQTKTPPEGARPLNEPTSIATPTNLK